MEKTLVCVNCGETVPRSGTRQKYCKDCAKKIALMQTVMAHRERASEKKRKKGATMTTGDTPEMIQMCLTCEKKRCIDCLRKYRKGGNNNDIS